MGKNPVRDLRALLVDLNTPTGWRPKRYDDTRIWSYGDVENNGVYYHPQLTHYTHQVFETFFFKSTQLHYSDLSGRDVVNAEARQRHSPPILHRMTFPVGWLHQWMIKPMRASDTFKTWIDTVDLSSHHIGVRAHVYDCKDELAGIVIWVRWARVLEPKPENITIPRWFPRRSRKE